MTGLALALALASAQPLGAWAPPPGGSSGWSGRIVDTPSLHVGARPAAFVDDGGSAPHRLELGAGVTLQVSWAGAI